MQPATPYDLKQLAQVSIFNFWSIPHTQLYTECPRLAGAGYMHERREDGGRHRRIYRLTRKGRATLDRWRSEPETDPFEMRDPAKVKLFLGAEPKALAEAQIEAHNVKLAEYRAVQDAAGDLPEGMRLVLAAGIAQEREMIRFWSSVREGRAIRAARG